MHNKLFHVNSWQCNSKLKSLAFFLMFVSMSVFMSVSPSISLSLSVVFLIYHLVYVALSRDINQSVAVIHSLFLVQLNHNNSHIHIRIFCFHSSKFFSALLCMIFFCNEQKNEFKDLKLSLNKNLFFEILKCISLFLV